MVQLKSCVPIQNGNKVPFWRRPAIILFLIVLLAAFLRLVNLGQSPPGLNQDEAANAWNAYCLLKTGKDQAGVSWPIFYIRGLGGNRATLHIYLLLPFQAIGGLNIVTTRLPAAVGGVLAVVLIYFVGKRLFNWKVGLVAAGFLAVNPWHLQQSRWGQDAALSPLFGIVPLAMLLLAKMPLVEGKNRNARPILAAVAGAVSGIVCYGYHAVRMFVPVFLLSLVLVTLNRWWHQLKTRRGALAIVCFVIGFAAIFGPLAFKHVTDPEVMARRGQSQLLWSETDPVGVKIQVVLSRYIGHFGPDFLFIRGDHYPIQTPPGAGQFHWYMLPLMVVGLVVLARRLKSSYAARVLLVYVLVYPIGDCFNQAISMHALRSSPGLCSLVLLAAVGAVSAGSWLWKQKRTKAVAVTAVFAVAVIGLNVRYLHRFYGRYNRHPIIYYAYHTDLVEACKWLGPRLDKFDAVFCTTEGMNHPYIITLVALGYEPQRWFSDRRDIITTKEFDIYTRYGKMHFMYGRSFIPALTQLQQNTDRNRIIFIVRPGELGLEKPIHQIYHPDGRAALWICRPEDKMSL